MPFDPMILVVLLTVTSADVSKPSPPERLKLNHGPDKFLVHEKFDSGNLFNVWERSWDREYPGRWENSTYKRKSYLTAPGLNSYHSITAVFDTPILFRDTDFVVQFYVRSDQNQTCSTVLLRIYGESDLTPRTLRRNSPFLFSFGPDFCDPAVSKSLFSFYGRNRETNEYEEKKLGDPAKAYLGPWGTLYQLFIYANNQYEIRVHGITISFGSFFTDFTPAVNPQSELVDPTDKKPSDWVDKEFIVDPTAQRPESLAEGEEWTPPKIRNPEFKGPWEPRKIPNPYYEEESQPHNFRNFTGVGFHVWTTDNAVMITDLIISHNLSGVKKYNAEVYPPDDILQRKVTVSYRVQQALRFRNTNVPSWLIFDGSFADGSILLWSLTGIVLITGSVITWALKRSQ
jgi:calnexin